MMNILTTGANRGIGAALAAEAEARGHSVIRHGRTSGDVACDLAALDTIPAAFGAIEGPVDVLINNAGIIGPAMSAGDGLEAHGFEQTFRINTFAPLAVAHALLPALRQSDAPRILNVSSQMSWMGYAKSDRIAYRASKAALNKEMQGLATDLAPDAIPVVLLDPGWVRTDMGGDTAEEDPVAVARGFLDIADRLTIADTGKFFRFSGEERAF
ncbi:MAG: short-chain dehydrogenase [Maritimibacter sp.]|nr:short-chain dehydrogenase [Maritimibacter sp.]|tara:strand:+ start:34894 stop:35532 length:639 start_codon:yes stop_codon:yes gene_type:complete